MKKIFGVIILIIGLSFSYLSVSALFPDSDTKDIFKDAITVTDKKIHPENEGKLVVVSGTIKPDKQIQDPLTGVKLPGVIADRNVWVYEYRNKKHDDKKDKDYYTWDWKKEMVVHSEETNFGINSEEEVSTTLYAGASIGEFKLDGRLLAGKIRSSSEFKNYDESSLKSGWYLHSSLIEPHNCVSRASYLPVKYKSERRPLDESSLGVGTKKISYTLPNSSNEPLTYSFIGIQKGDTLTRSDDIYIAYEGILTADEMAEKESDNRRNGSIFGLVASVLVTLLGLKLILSKKKERSS